MMSMQIEISNQVLVRDLDGEAVILDLKSQRYFGLDEVGLVTWQLISQFPDVEVVKEKMLQEFEVDLARLEEDLEVFLGRLEEEGLITVHGRSPETQRGTDLAAKTS